MDKKIKIVFVINGKEQAEEVNINQPLGAARNEALAHSHNTGRPAEEWAIYNDQGTELDPGAKIETFGFSDGVRLTLTLKVGAGG
jgi:hypothetical protein